MDIFEMDEEAREKWVGGAIDFGRKMVEKGIHIIELDGRGVKITPPKNDLFLNGLLYLGFKLHGVERVEIRKYGNPVSLTEVWVHHGDGMSALKIPDID